MEPMYYIRLDVHKRKISYCVKDGGGKVYAEGWISATRQRLSRLPSAPDLTLLDRRKPKPHPWPHANTTFTEQIYLRWCCIDLSNAPRLPGPVAI
jgi:hypothetical protein